MSSEERIANMEATLDVVYRWIEGIYQRQIKLPDGKQYFVVVPKLNGQGMELSPRLLKALNAEEVK